MRGKWRRLAAGLLSIIMLITMLPMEALAANSGSKENPSSQTMPFQDVKSSDWYAEAVEYVYSHNIFSGTSATTFTPNGTMTRGMFVTVLGRMAGVDSGDYSGETSFSDVPQTMYYAPYVQWAAKYSITTGTSKGKFSPDAFIDRAQMAVFFVRYFETLGVEYDTGTDIASEPADMASIPAYAQDAVRKLWKQGLLNGDGKNFAPRSSATRAQMAALCMRADSAVKVWYSAPGVVGRKSGETSNNDSQSQTNNNGGGSSGGSGSGGNHSSGTSRTITLHLPDGTTSAFTQTGSVLSLANLPTPSVAGKAFIGWYYDEKYTKAVTDGDPVSDNLSLYAKMADYDSTEGVETPSYAGATDVETSFTITIKSSSSGSDLTDKIKLVGTEQPTSKTDADGNTITTVGSVTKSSGGTYTVSPPEGGWAEGGTYKVVLEDDSLTFAGQETSVREYDFTVKVGEPTLDWHLKDDVVTIPASSIQSIKQNGKAVAALDMPIVTFDGSSASTDSASDSTGTFAYAGNLAVGDTVAVYEGTAPDERVAFGTDDDNTGDISYVKITEVDKSTNTYTYQAAAVEDILFVPDVLPVKDSHKAADTSGDHTISVPVEELTFTASSGLEKLDESTTVDVGDFIAFYKGTSYTNENITSDGYGRITKVDVTDDSGTDYYQLTYTDATKDNVLSSMDVDTSDPVSGDAMLEGINAAELKSEIAQQAIDSGFAQNVADRISVALDRMDLSSMTENGEINLSAADIDPDNSLDLSALTLNTASLTNTLPLAAANTGSGSKANVKVKSVAIKKTLENFKDANGNGLSGVRLELQLEVTKTVQKEGGNIVITVTPTFIQELKLDLTTHGKVVWKHKFIFYWISDVYLEAGLNVYTYTAINLDATITSEGEKDTVTKVKDLVGKLGEKLDALEGKKSESTEIDTSKLNLQELYQNMLELDSDWVELYRKNILHMKKTVAKIIKFELTTDFVVELNLRMAMGMNFNYTNAKRFVFGVYLFKRKTTSHTYNLVNEQYNLRLYAMGAVGLRAGVEIYPSVSLISKKVATVGIVAKVGAYLKGYGYLLYNLKYEAGKPKTADSSGALYVEVGMFMDISANLAAWKGKVTWTPEIYTDETPLWTVGNKHAVTAFSMEDADGVDDEPIVYLKEGSLNVPLPNSLRTLTGFDLTTGETVTELYDWNKIDISFDDSRFTTGSNGSSVKLNLADWQTREDPQIDCVMTLTYKGSDLSFSSTPIQLKVKVHWDRLRDGYPIHELNSEGAYIGWEQRNFGAALNLTTPVRVGYNFVGWKYYTLKDESNIFSYTEADLYTDKTMPESALVAVAQFTPQTNVLYKLNFYLQNADGSYPDIPNVSEVHNDGAADATIVPDNTLVPDKATYNSPDRPGIYVRPDGAGEQNYYYSRTRYTLTLNSGSSISTVSYRWGDTINLPDDPSHLGYTFGGWYTDESCTKLFTETTMPAADTTLYAKWVPNDITYFVVLRKEGANGKWTQTTVTQTGKTDETVALRPEEFLTEAEKTEYDYPETVSYTVSAEDGGTVSLSYTRKKFNLTYDLNGDGASWVSNPGNVSYRVGATLKLLTQSYLTRAGYTFDGWYTDAACEKAFTETTMPAENITLYAKWTAQGNISYTVEHYQQNVTGDDYTLVSADTETKTGVTGEKTDAAAKSYTGFTAQTITQETINGNGKTVVKVYYTRNEYTLTYNLNSTDASWTDSEAAASHTYRYGSAVTTPTSNELSRAGYAFGGWYTDADCETEFTATTMPAEDTTLYAKWNTGQVNYTVNYYLQNVDGETYPEKPTKIVSGSGVTGQKVAIECETFEGFTLDSTYENPLTSITLSADSTKNVINIHCARRCYNLMVCLNAEETDITGSYLHSNRVYYGAALNTDMSQATRTGYTFVGWYTDENCTTRWEGTTMPACEGNDFNLYAKWDAITYTLRFDWDGNVALRDWLLDEEIGGKMLTAEYDSANYVYINANNNGIPYIDVTVKYDQVFTLPTDITGIDYFGYYKEVTDEWGTNKVLEKAETLTQMATKQGAIVEVGISWRNETSSSDGTMIYNASQFQNQVVRGSSSDTQYALGVDLDLCNVTMTPNDGMPVENIAFNGNGHTIFNVTRGEVVLRQAAGTIYGYGDNVTVKNLTIDGMTIDYTAGYNYYHAFGALAGFVGDGFKAENVTVQNVTMNLNLLGEEGTTSYSYHLLPAESIGGLIGYAKGSVTLTGCTVSGMTVNVTDTNDSKETQFLIGGLIGYADALYTQLQGNTEHSYYNDYNRDGSVNISGCTVDMAVSKNGAAGVTVGGLVGGIGNSVTSKTGTTYSVTANIDSTSTFPTGLASIGKELTLDYSESTTEGTGTDASTSEEDAAA